MWQPKSVNGAICIEVSTWSSWTTGPPGTSHHSDQITSRVTPMYHHVCPCPIWFFCDIECSSHGSLDGPVSIGECWRRFWVEGVYLDVSGCQRIPRHATTIELIHPMDCAEPHACPWPWMQIFHRMSSGAGMFHADIGGEDGCQRRTHLLESVTMGRDAGGWVA